MYVAKTRIKLLVLALLLCVPSSASDQSVPQLARKTLSATVSLEMQDKNGDTFKQGSGFFVRGGLIATNFHVIDGASKGYARLVNTATPYPIEGIAATDKANDLALLKVTAHGITPLPIGDSDSVQIGETVYVAGNPAGFEGTFSDGIISGRRESFTRKERLQMTAPISKGSSGGPVLNRKGEVIGISTALYNPLLGQHIYFAVPSKALRKLLHRPGKSKPVASIKKTGSYTTYLLRGYEKASSGDYEGAIREFTRAIRSNPDYPAYGRYAALVGRGTARNILGQHSRAIANFDAAILLRSDDVTVYLGRGSARLALGKFASSIIDFNAVIRLEPKLAAGYCGRGAGRLGLGEVLTARKDLRIALRLATREGNQNLKYQIEKALRILEEQQ